MAAASFLLTISKLSRYPLPVAIVSLLITLRKLVPAIEPDTWLSAMIPKDAVASSMLTFINLATGATYFMDSWNLPISSVLLENDSAITSVILPVSWAVIPNPRIVPPATAAAVAKSVLVAAARFKVASVAPIISSVVKPSFANSVCNSTT